MHIRRFSSDLKTKIPGDAVLWPAKLDHTVWTENEELQAIVIDGPPERE